MDIAEVKVWLNRGYKINREIEAIERSKANLYSRAVSVTPNYSGETVSGTKDPRKMDGYLEAVERYAGQAEERVRELADISGEILYVVRQISDNRERMVLIERYLNFLEWEQIAVKMNYTYRNVIYIHGAALKSVKIVLETFPFFSHA